MTTHIIGEEDPVVFVIFRRVDPRVANKVNTAFAEEVLERHRLEEELGTVLVLYYHCPWYPMVLVPVERHRERGLPGGYGRQRRNVVLQVRRLPHYPPVTIICTYNPKAYITTKEMKTTVQHIYKSYFKEKELTGVACGGADELQGDSLAEEFVDVVDEGGTKVGEVEDILLHQHHRSLDITLRSADVRAHGATDAVYNGADGATNAAYDGAHGVTDAA